MEFGGRWDFYDRYRVGLKVILAYRPMVLPSPELTDAEIQKIWPQPNPPNWDYENNRPYPLHIMHHKHREWLAGRMWASSSASSLVQFLQSADDGNKWLFYSWVWHNKLNTDERRSTIPEYSYLSATQVFRVHNFFLSVAFYNCQSSKEVLQSTLESIVDTKTFPWDLVHAYENDPVTAFYTRTTPAEQQMLVDDHNYRLHPKEEGRVAPNTLATRPFLTQRERKCKAACDFLAGISDGDDDATHDLALAYVSQIFQ